jgi:hypothetical protein
MPDIIISNLVSHKRRKLGLSEEEFNSLRESLDILERDQEMEMLHDQVMEAFWDYRNKVDYWRLRSLAGFRTQILSYEVRSTLNRLAFNVLNLSKLFLDKHYQVNGRCFVFEQTKLIADREKVEANRIDIYKENLRYFVGCKLRNKAQHGHLPVSQFSSGFKLRKADGQKFIVFNITFNYQELKELGVSESRLLPEIKLDLTEILDGYVYAVSEMHLHNRALTEGVRLQSYEHLKETLSSALASEESDSCFVDLQPSESESEYIGLDRFELAERLRKKHPYSIDYSKFAFGLDGY